MPMLGHTYQTLYSFVDNNILTSSNSKEESVDKGAKKEEIRKKNIAFPREREGATGGHPQGFRCCDKTLA